ncbi:MAG: nucleoid-associated protein [Armatimonadetes bacterium]|nr:nucleoid-associated protein [Candidatus Hippobium faecium]
MLGIEAIDIKKIVIHKIDYENNSVVLSEKYESLGQNLCEYFTKHIRNIIGASNAKTGKFLSGECTVANCVEKITESGEDLLENSKLMAYWFLESFRKDKINFTFLAFIEFADAETNRRYVAVLKLDPQTNYVMGKDGTVEQIQTFPDCSKPLNRGLIARPYDYNNTYDTVYRNQSVGKGEDPDTGRFFIEGFMEAEDVPSPKYLTQLVLKETEKWAERNADVLSDDEPEILMNTVKNLAQSEEMDVAEAAEEALAEEEMKVRYINNLLDKGLRETTFAPDRAYAEKAAKKATYICDFNVKISGSKEALAEIMSFEKKDGRTEVVLKTGKFTQK